MLGAAARRSVAVLPLRGSCVGPPTVCQFPEGVEAVLKIRAQPEGIEGLILDGERDAALWGEDSAGEQPTIGRLRAIISLDHPGAVALLGDQFAEGLKEVPIEPEDPVNRAGLFVGRAGAVAIIADEPADDGPVFCSA